MTGNLTADHIRELARRCGFELAGVAAAVPAPDRTRYHEWVAAGRAGKMAYLTDRRAALRDDPRHLLGSARSVISAGKLYQTPWPHSTRFHDAECAWISRYAWGEDYHDVMRRGLERLDGIAAGGRGRGVRIAHLRGYGAVAGALLRAPGGAGVDRAEYLPDQPAAGLVVFPGRVAGVDGDRAGRAAAGPLRHLHALRGGVPHGGAGAGQGLDATLCISYFTIELRGAIPEEQRAGIGAHVFGCDICQDVCPWNGRAPVTDDPAFAPRQFAPRLEELAAIPEEEFRAMFRGTPLIRARYSGFLRNVAVAMGNARHEKFRAPLEKMAESGDAVVAEHARWALGRMAGT